jgi:biotin carboxylase
MSEPRTILVLASYEKGHNFLRSAKAQGWRVVLLTSQSLKDEAEWPREAIDEIFYMPDVDKVWDREQTLRAVSYLARTRRFERIVPLDDFDLECAAMLREHLRVPGMGDTTTRHFRDKLAMRVRARSAGLRIPDFVHLLNDQDIAEFVRTVPAPWVLKPRFLAGAIGIKKAHDAAELEAHVRKLGDERSFYVLERYVPGDVFHVDTLVHDKVILFARASQYGRPPLNVSHDGDVFTSRLLDPQGEAAQALVAMNAQVLEAMRLVRGASHTEFIRGHDDGQFYFLETSARVGGAHLSEMVAAGTGIDLWAEWARSEIAGEDGDYVLPATRDECAGLLISLARDEWPDTSSFDDPEVVWRLKKRHHVGLVVRSPSQKRVDELLERYLELLRRDHHAVAPPQEKATD